mmetsp:Transcript_1068/g.957  ORF Transcript_1068/g.957 Transcript_1068/m.957 type:complete len:128 (-) Transcript_1068:135-518(-)|eukprot:CAMPEP_0114582660 /NCGR_PEP_ID=MMETSP0125-20121206/6587_1 /TAXON_ID=485358 ORGANISM="Aristerostoma sp., Strain ATCC 50986" /NCGR_SAMPLE_ID=MMETSP0125 /ASSEMBLY_ACC=CAM_ASM_000245 /LENGTH=127 /DNA_ID=CAMNT_0001775727 /DNA_START=15 /DNA_END=398 /DNA_ORIENTATION=-
MSKKVFKKPEGSSIISIIGDEDTVCGFLLTGVGERNIKGETNFMVVDAKTTTKQIEDTFKRFVKSSNIAILLVNQHIANQHLRHLINDYDQIVPTILEIPSKDHPYEPKSDTIMQKANRLLYGTELE